MNLALQKKQTESTGLNASYILHKNKDGNTISAQAGELITATITNKTDQKISLQAFDYNFDTAVGSVKGEVGEQVSFQVLKNDSEGLVLKQVFSAREKLAANTGKESIKQQAYSSIKDLLKQNNLLREDSALRPEDRLEEQLKTMKAIAKIKRQLAYPSSNASRSAVNELVASGLSLQKISLSILNSVMKEIEEKPVKNISPKKLSQLVNDYFNQEGALQKAKPDKDKVKALVSRALPITESNLNALEKVLRQASEIENLDDGAIAELIQKETPLTLESVYIAKFSSKESLRARGPLSEGTWKALLPGIEKIFERELVEDTPENAKAARFLVENECSVTKENILKRSFLLHAGEQLDRQELLNAAAQNIKQDKPVTEITLQSQPSQEQSRTNRLYENYCNIIETLPRVTTGDIASLINRRKSVTLKNVTDKLPEPQPQEEVHLPETETAYATETLTAKRQVTEIMLKLTYEAAYRLSQKNIRIDTVPLSQALERLKALEQDGYEKNLRAMGVASDDGKMEEKKTLMSGLYEKLSNIRSALTQTAFPVRPVHNVLGDVLSKKISFTIDSVHSSIRTGRTSGGEAGFPEGKDSEQASRTSMEALRAAYDSQQDANPKYGDSFEKISGQFASLLERLGIDQSVENLRAASILSRSALDVTEENITKIKGIDLKLNRLVNRLHPNIAASMIQEGLNPVEMQIDQVLDYIKGFEQMHGNSPAEKITEHILALDEKHGIDGTIREPMMAFYRMLHMIEKNGAAALGVALKNNRSMTLGDLLEASKTYSRTQKGVQLDYSVDDRFGRLSDLVKPETSIRSILEKASRENPAQNPAVEYQGQLLTTLGELASPYKLQAFLQQQPDLQERTLEEFVRELARNSLPNKEQLPREAADFYARQLQNLASVPPSIVQALDANHIYPSLGNILAMQRLEAAEHLGNVLDDLDESNEKTALMEEIPDTGLQEWIEGASPEALLDSLTRKIEQLKERISSRKKLWDLTLMQNAAQIQNTLHQNGGSLKLPIRLAQQISSLNLYIVNHDVKDEMKIVMSLDTKAFGQVQAFIATDGSNAGLQISADTQEALDTLRESRPHLETYLEDSPMQINELRFVLSDGKTKARPGARDVFPVQSGGQPRADTKGQRLSFQNASSKEIKKLVSAITRMIEDAQRTLQMEFAATKGKVDEI